MFNLQWLLGNENIWYRIITYVPITKTVLLFIFNIISYNKKNESFDHVKIEKMQLIPDEA